jgi:hypothetical protein
MKSRVVHPAGAVGAPSLRHSRARSPAAAFLPRLARVLGAVGALLGAAGLSGCYYYPASYYPAGYYTSYYSTTAAQAADPQHPQPQEQAQAQMQGQPQDQSAVPGAPQQAAPTYAVAAPPVYVAPPVYPAYYPPPFYPYPAYYGYPGWYGPSIAIGFGGYWGGHWGGHGHGHGHWH